ncbi:MAG TPA: carbohydrate kinase family protein [Candidatus Magasanikbacteria bacterium]|nr:carbohydrate kinase family protein [Candidatus Magasanikbacteria bacterium]
MYNLLTIGDAVVDNHIILDEAEVECNVDKKTCRLCLDYAAKVPVSESFQNIGGNAVNTAIGASKLGLNTAILTDLGKDANGKTVISELKKYGVDTKLIKLNPKNETRFAIVLNYKGERTILSSHKKKVYSWPTILPKTDWIYYTSLSDGFETLQKNLFAHLKKHPTVRLVYNPGSFQLKNSLSSVLETIKKSDILIVNLQEAETILNTTLQKEKSMATIIHKLLALGAKEVVITDAEKGAYAGSVEEVWYMPSFPVQVIAKTGAGDAFSSGYISARQYDHDIADALLWGIANSCSVISSFGSHAKLLEKGNITNYIKKHSEIQPKKIA